MHLQNRCLILISVFHVCATYEQILQLMPPPLFGLENEIRGRDFLWHIIEKNCRTNTKAATGVISLIIY